MMRTLALILLATCMCGFWQGLVDSAGIPLACELRMKYEQCTSEEGAHNLPEKSDNRRVVAVGDVHGSHVGLLEVLYQANVTSARDSCTWRPQGTGEDDGVVLVQMGDLTDRGPGALEVLECLRKLQNEAAAYNSKVIRLIGSKYICYARPFKCTVLLYAFVKHPVLFNMSALFLCKHIAITMINYFQTMSCGG